MISVFGVLGTVSYQIQILQMRLSSLATFVILHHFSVLNQANGCFCKF